MQIEMTFANLSGLAAERVMRFVINAIEIANKKYNKYLIVLLAITFVSAGAISETNENLPPIAATPTTVVAYDAENLIAAIGNAVTNAINQIGVSPDIKQIGTIITAFFIGALTIWNLLKVMATGKGFGDFISEMVPVLVGFAIVYLFTERRAGDLLVDMMGTIGSAVTGTPVNMNDYTNAITSALAPTFESISKTMAMPRATDGLDSTGVMDAIANGVASLGASIFAYIAKGLVLFLMLISSLVMIATITTGYISLKLALAFAPILVPFILFKPLTFLFDGWLRFLISACMLFIVVVFFQRLAGGLQGEMVNLANNIYENTRGANAPSALDALRTDIVLYSVMALLAMLSGMLMASAPSIASGLVSGSAGGIGFSGLKGLGQSTGGKVGSAIAGKVVGTVKNVGGDLGRTLTGGGGASKVQTPSIGKGVKAAPGSGT